MIPDTLLKKFCESDGQRPSNKLRPLGRYFWATLYINEIMEHCGEGSKKWIGEQFKILEHRVKSKADINKRLRF